MDLVNGGKETNKQTPCIRVLTKNKNFFNWPEHLIRCSTFSVKCDGAFDFSINQVFFVNKPVTENIEIATSGNTTQLCLLFMSSQLC